MLPWFSNNQFPLYLAPMAGVTDIVFRSICKELGADVMVTEFVATEGIIRQDKRTKKYTEFTDDQHPCGVQLFGANGERMGMAAQKIIDWKQPEFIDINFGCPVSKVVGKNGGSSLLKDLKLLASVAQGVHKAVGEHTPVTAKIRIGWDEKHINGPEVCHILEEEGMCAITVHGRTKSQAYRGEADWDVIDACARRVSVPVIGNGDIHSGADVKHRKETTAVAGVMIGRAAMQNPWVFQEAKHYLATGETPPPVSVHERWKMIIHHCDKAIKSKRYGNERQTIMAMRSRLMAYCKGFPGAKPLRQKLCHVESLQEIKTMADTHRQEFLEMDSLSR